MELIEESLVEKEKGFENPYSYIVPEKHMNVAKNFEFVIINVPKEEEGIEDIQKINRILEEIMQTKIKYEDVNSNHQAIELSSVVMQPVEEAIEMDNFF